MKEKTEPLNKTKNLFYYLKYFILLLFFSHKINAQKNYIEYFNKINEAEYQYSLGNYKSALLYFDFALKNNKILRRDVYTYAELLCINNKVKRAKAILLQFAKLGYNRDILFYKNPNFEAIKNDSNFIKQIYIESEGKHIVDIKLSKFVDSINHIEDSLRNTITTFFPKYEDGVGWQKFYTLYPYYKEFHEYFMNYCRKNGYPSYIKSGTDLARLLLVHISTEYSLELEKIMYRQLCNGEVLPIEYANLVDKPSFFSDSAQNCKYYVLKQCKNPQNWDEIINNRKDIGLSVYFNGFQANLPSFKMPKLTPNN